MADGQQATQDPLAESAQAESGQVDPALVAPNAGERILGMGVTPGGSLDRRLQQYHAAKLAQAKMYRGNLASSVAQIAKGTKWDATLNNGAGGERPLTQDELTDLNNQKDEATKQYNKIIGVDPESKGALDKAHSIIDFILGRKQQQQQAQQQQGRPGGIPPPPTPQYGSTVTEQGVIPTPMPGTNVGEKGVAITPPPSPMPQPSALEQSVAAPMLRHQMALSQARSTGLQTQQAQFKQQHDEWKSEADKLFDPNSREYKWYAATGKLPPVFKMQKGPIVQDANGIPVQSIFSPEGEYLDPDTMEKIEGAQPMSAADLRTATINLMTPDGPRTMFRKGNKVYDNHGNLQDGELVPFIRGMVPTTTDREVMGFDSEGNPTKYLLRSTRTINMGPTPSPMATPPTGGGAAPSTSSGGAAGRMSAPPKLQGSQGSGPVAQGGGSKAGKTVFPAGQFMQFSKSATGVDQARNSLVGDEIEKGQIGGLAKDLDIFKDPSAVARIGEYLQLVHNLTAREGDSFAQSDDTIGAVKWFAGMPQAVIGLQQGALRDKYNTLTSADKKFVADYFRAMGTMGGMRASTGMPGYQWSFTNMYNEMPTPGKVTDYDDAVRRLVNYVKETNVVSKRNPMVPKVDVNDAEKQIRGSSNKLTPPPAASSSSRPPLSSFEH